MTPTSSSSPVFGDAVIRNHCRAGVRVPGRVSEPWAELEELETGEIRKEKAAFCHVGFISPLPPKAAREQRREQGPQAAQIE